MKRVLQQVAVLLKQFVEFAECRQHKASASYRLGGLPSGPSWCSPEGGRGGLLIKSRDLGLPSGPSWCNP